MFLRSLPSIVVFFFLACPSWAAEFTDVVDAADDFDDFDTATHDPFDFHIEPTFEAALSSAQISREAACVPSESDIVGEAAMANPRVEVSPGRCREARVVSNKEMLYKGVKNSLKVDLRVGLFKDLELRLRIPYVFHSSRGLKYANEGSQIVDESNSSVDPRTQDIQAAANASFRSDVSAAGNVKALDAFTYYRYFDLGSDYSTYERSGFADPTIGIHWAPLNDERDSTKATLFLAMDYTMPIVPIAEARDQDVGRGLHELHWTLASSKKFSWIEPYFGLEFLLPLSATDSPIGDKDPQNNGQVFTSAPLFGQITIGTEFIPYEDPERNIRHSIDFGFRFGYTSEGRDYTPLFDHISESECNGKTLEDVLPKFDAMGNVSNPDDVACAWIVRQPSNGDPLPVYDLASASENPSGTQFSSDGIMTVESYGTFAGTLGFNLQPSEYFKFRASATLKHDQEHYLTNARTGRDADDQYEVTPDSTVDLEGVDASIEKNPVYNPSYDTSGNRFRIQASNTWLFNVGIALQF
jgi:hypothetical protein